MRLLLVLSSLLLLASPAVAQEAGGSHRGRHGGGRAQTVSKETPPEPTFKPDPRQRLDVGALLCDTHEKLLQHQAAVAARLDGRDEPDPAGCHQVIAMTPVSVISRDGPAATEVRFAGTAQQTGWTDVVIPAATAQK